LKSPDMVIAMYFFVKLFLGVLVVLVITFLGFFQEAKHDFKAWQEKRRKRQS
jgi:hypothetical protein